jgi:hypothetical protein
MPKRTKTTYPRIKQLGIKITTRKGFAYITWDELNRGLEEANSISKARFDKLFGVQTCSVYGPYPWDVEAVLEKMLSGKVTGSQLIWD